MFEHCLALGGSSDDPLRELALISLAMPWLILAATWIISLKFYDSTLLFASVILHYGLYLLLTVIASNWGIPSPLAKECTGVAAMLFGGYHHIWPSPLLISTLSYVVFLVSRHIERREEWWSHLVVASWFRVVIFYFNIVLPLIYFLVGLWYLGVSPALNIMVNATVGVGIGLLLFLFTYLNEGWRRCARRLNRRMDW